MASFGLLSGLIVATTTPVYAAVGFCNQAYLTVYDGKTQGSANRTFCYGLDDSDIESEPGTVMGPLGDGSPVVRKDDFNTSATSSGVSSVFFYSASGTYTACLYAGKNFDGGLFAIEHTFSVGDYHTVLGVTDNTMGSIKIIHADGSACP